MNVAQADNCENIVVPHNSLIHLLVVDRVSWFVWVTSHSFPVFRFRVR